MVLRLNTHRGVRPVEGEGRMRGELGPPPTSTPPPPTVTTPSLGTSPRVGGGGASAVIGRTARVSPPPSSPHFMNSVPSRGVEVDRARVKSSRVGRGREHVALTPPADAAAAAEEEEEEA